KSFKYMKKKYATQWRTILLLMRLTSYIIVLITISAQLIMASNTSGQSIKNKIIDIDINNKSLKEALAEIQRVSGFRFVYDNALIEPYEGITISMKNKSVDELLRQITRNTPLTYTE